MDDKEKRQLENQLLTLGLAGVSYSEFIQQLARLISDFKGDRHRFMEDLINECPPEKRYERYHALLPYLLFEVLPLDDYDARIANRASEMVSHGWMRVEGRRPHPIELGGTKYSEVPSELATHAIATLKCQRKQCKRAMRFLSDTPAGAMIEARKAGWSRIAGRETCPKCVAKVKAIVN